MKVTNDVPVDIFIRISRDEKDSRERALFIAKRKDNGSEFTLCARDVNDELQDLIVCDVI